MIESLNNLLIEYQLEKKRYYFLLDQEEELLTRYFSFTSTIKEVVVSEGSSQDKYINYLIDLDKKRFNGLTLREEQERQLQKVQGIKKQLEDRIRALSKLEGIEYELLDCILAKGMKPTPAVEKVAELNFMDPSNIWKRYYPQIKGIVDAIFNTNK